MTSNWKEFKDFVEKKFGSLSNFSKIVTGSFTSYKGLENLTDVVETSNWRIYHLKKLAIKTKFELKKVEISDFEIKAIKSRMEFIIITTDYKNDAEWLKDNCILHPLYSAIIHGRIVRKNCAYERLMTKLWL